MFFFKYSPRLFCAAVDVSFGSFVFMLRLILLRARLSAVAQGFGVLETFSFRMNFFFQFIISIFLMFLDLLNACTYR